MNIPYIYIYIYIIYIYIFLYIYIANIANPKIGQQHEIKNIFTSLFNAHNTIGLSTHEQIILMRLHFKILLLSYGRSISFDA